MKYDLKRVVKFLHELNTHNSKTFMDANRDEYLKCKEIWLKLIDEVVGYVYSLDNSIGFIDPKDTIFRINRDVRFSHNKDPYNSHFSSLISRNGRKSAFAGYYFRINHLGELFIGGGLFEPEKEILENFRYYLNQESNGNQLNKYLNTKSIKSTFGLLEDYKLKRSPRGWENSDFNDFMLYKSFVLSSQSSLNDHPEIVIKEKLKLLSGFITILNNGILTKPSD
jgi:uncharacterized protein (TIGR02453 family)